MVNVYEKYFGKISSNSFEYLRKNIIQSDFRFLFKKYEPINDSGDSMYKLKY